MQTKKGCHLAAFFFGPEILVVYCQKRSKTFLDKNNLGQLLKLSMFELPFLWQTIQLETS
ncbi:hypothetical protein VCHA43P277_120182 [Vibrio chagasii]|nr:hypothetical protein VCHA34P126_100015 [Vibrio chagasii]CAK2517394.1 hypothetical protein VCRA2111O136_50129 [Vibrio crassostreae]CAH6802083.1 hypothetical protein VCHA35P150_100181 [Vibrio chagasii]CAH6929307.1 hypothetical protein VCHA43P277_120182 [Vibrio chagasii]CAH6931450.1 hypothetical protein VCHA50O407_110181 [Vibrio chagasii]